MKPLASFNIVIVKPLDSFNMIKHETTFGHFPEVFVTTRTLKNIYFSSPW